MRILNHNELREVSGGKITPVTTTSQLNGGGKTPSGEANGVPIVSTTTNLNPTGKAPAGHN
jgi:hypothetical protein